ncbi:hypothetical protein [Geminicoccus harenae]|uniref:hypothetical protein n=1 Tax=Geminicoccus harenae TaxID=2498453 RepID=UPI001C95E5B5|nr:hypothetical protein [Geminicoccus harenae]
MDGRLSAPVLWRVTAALLAVVLLIPLFAAEIPPILDYPNHLARMKILAEGPANPVLSRMYEIQWGLIPNIAIDLVMPPMLQFMPLFAAGKVMLAITVLLPVAGAILFSRALFGNWSFWSLGSGLVAYNGITLLGFMNFQIGLGLALIVAAGWIAWRNRMPAATVLGAALGAIVLFFLHIFSVLFLAVLLGSYELMRLHPQQRPGQPVWPALLRSALMLGCVLVVPVLFLALAPISDNPAAADWRPLGSKPAGLFLPFLNYWVGLDFGTGALVGAFVLLSWWRGWMRVPPCTVIAMLVLGLGYFLSPFLLMGASFVDYRMPAMMGFLLFAGMVPDRLPRWLAASAGTGFALLFLVRMAILVLVWIDSRVDVARVREAIAGVEPGSKVLVAISEQKDNPRYWQEGMRRSRQVSGLASTFLHLAALLSIERNAFWPLLFAEPGKQPLRARPPYDALSLPEGRPPSYRLLSPEAARTGLDPEDLAKAPYLKDWARQYDFVLILNAGGVPDLHRVNPDKLDLLTANDTAALFRVAEAPGE